MNSLHEDLFRKAMMYVHEHTDDQTSDREQDFMLMEKFAELVVEECVLQCHHNDDMDRIEKHFGLIE
jgi:hypothetical protein